MPWANTFLILIEQSWFQFILALSKNLKLHIIKDNGELYLAGPDLVVLVPNFEQQISNLKMKIEVKEIDADSHPHILLECVK